MGIKSACLTSHDITTISVNHTVFMYYEFLILK